MAIKLKGSTDGSVTLEAPADTSPSGTNKTFSLPAADGTDGQVLSTNGSGALSFASVPALAITDVDQWYLTGDITTDETYLTSSNVARNNFTGAAQIGTGMSISNEHWTFPKTGKWLVILNSMFYMAGGDSINGVIFASTDGGTNYDLVTFAVDGNSTGSSNYGGCSAMYFIDITDTSTDKVSLYYNSIASGSVVRGDSARIETNALFIRLGDT